MAKQQLETQETAEESVLNLEALTEGEDQGEDFEAGTDELGEDPEKKTVTTEPVEYNPLWDVVGEKFGTEEQKFEIPEAIKSGELEEGKTELDYLIDSIKPHITPEETQAILPEDPFVQEYMIASQEENFNIGDWMMRQTTAFRVLAMDSPDFLRAWYKQTGGQTEENPKGYTDEDIEKYLNSKSKIDLNVEAEEKKKQYYQVQEEQRKGRLDKLSTANVQQFEAQEQANKELVDKYVETIKEDKTFMGVEFSEAEKEQYLKEVHDIFKRDPKTRSNKIEEALQSDDFMLEIAPLVWLVLNKKFKDKVTSLKETVKAKVEDKLGSGPKEKEGTASQPQDFDPTKLQ